MNDGGGRSASHKEVRSWVKEFFGMIWMKRGMKAGERRDTCSLFFAVTGDSIVVTSTGIATCGVSIESPAHFSKCGIGMVADLMDDTFLSQRSFSPAATLSLMGVTGR
jgi:hypothetical protein